MVNGTNLAPEVVRLAPTSGWRALGIKELLKYRELLYFLAWRDVKVRYKQTIFGAAWAILQPVLAMVVFSIFFGRLANMPSDGLPYPVFSYAGLLPWTMFATGLSQSALSMVGSANLVTKVYFPRLLIPMAAVVPSVVDFALAFLVLAGMMVWYGIAPTAGALLLPLFILLALVTVLGTGFWLAALNVRFRDVRFAVPFIIQIWLFATPVVYPSSLLSEPWRTLYALNPMVGVVDGFRWGLLGTGRAPGLSTALSAAMAVVMFVSGMFYFRRMERTFADSV